MMLLLTLALTLTSTLAAAASLSAQDAAGMVYLPLVQSNQDGADLTQDEDGGEMDEPVEVDRVAELGAAISFDVASGQGWGGGRSGLCGDGRGGRRWGNWRGALEVVGLTADGRLICFDEYNPRSADTIGAVSGLTVDTALVGIDFRPATGELYGLGNAGGVYTLNLATAEATLRSRLNMALAGSAFGVDFNPTVDRLRITGNTGQNLRVNVDDGATIADGMLTYTPMTPTLGIAGVAYTNNDADPNTATTLFDIDAALDQVAIQSPANSGQLVATGKLTANTGEAVGFDLYSIMRDGTTTDVRGLASLTVDGQARLYRINLLTGKARLLGTFRSQNQVIGLAFPLNQR
jgi:hypothetical protein